MSAHIPRRLRAVFTSDQRDRVRARAEQANRFLLGRYVAPVVLLILAFLVFAPFAATPEEKSNDNALLLWIGIVLSFSGIIMLYANYTAKDRDPWTWRALGVFGVVIGFAALLLTAALNVYGWLDIYFSERTRDFIRAFCWVSATLLFFGCLGWVSEENDGRFGCWLRAKLGKGSCPSRVPPPVEESHEPR